MKLCALYPHLKDSYWLSVNQGMVEAAQAHQVQLKVMEAGGYQNQAIQLAQISKCLQWQADLILLGSVSYELPNAVAQAAETTPIISVVNATDPYYVQSLVGVSWYQMGRALAQGLAEHYPKENTLNALMLLGPRGRGGNQFMRKGLLDALPEQIQIQATLYGENSPSAQRRLLTSYLKTHPAPDLIIGGAVSVEVAINEVQNSHTDIISTYLSHGVYRGLMRDKVKMAITDNMRQQGEMAVNYAVKYLKGESIPQQVGPQISLLTPSNLGEPDTSLSDPWFQATYEVKPRSPDPIP